MKIESIKIVVVATAIVRRLPVESRDGAGQYRELLACIIANYANILSYLRSFRHQGQLSRVYKFEMLRVIAEKAKIMNRISIDWNKFNFFLIRKNRLCDDRARCYHMAVRKY